MKKYYIDVVYRDENLAPTQTRTYTLEEYANMLQHDLFRLISDIEDLVYVMNDYQPRTAWTDESWARFNAIRHKMLDKAGDIGRLHETIRVEDAKEAADNGQSNP